MTVTYLEYIPTAKCTNIFKILTVWRGSIFKGIWKLLLFYSLFYAVISFSYRFIISEEEEIKQSFEKLCIFCGKYQDLFPLHFILGFYVTQVSRQSRPWPR